MYEINVSKNGEHIFATAEHSVTSIYALKRVYPLLKEKFPESEGYEITVTEWEKIGTPIKNVKEYIGDRKI